MSETKVVAKNEDAERLWNYIVAYRSRIEGRQLGSNWSLEALPLQEEITLSV